MSICITILFFRVSVTIEPGRSLLTVRYRELFDTYLVRRKRQGEGGGRNKFMLIPRDFFLFFLGGRGCKKP